MARRHETQAGTAPPERPRGLRVAVGSLAAVAGQGGAGRPASRAGQVPRLPGERAVEEDIALGRDLRAVALRELGPRGVC